MENKLTEKHRILGSRNRRSSHSFAIPVSGHRGITTADGFGSPTDQVYSPPGVLTKLDSLLVKTKQSSPKRMRCVCCSEKTNCSCKKCTLEILAFYSKKENIYVQNEKKTRLQGEIYDVQHDLDSKCAEITFKSERIIRLKKMIADIEARIAQKRTEINNIEEKRKCNKKFERNCAEGNEKQEIKLTKYDLLKNQKKEHLILNESKLANTRRIFCTAACRVFPIQEIEVNVEDAETAPRNARNWTVVDRTEAGRRYAVRCAYLNEHLKNRLENSIASGSISLSTDLHPALAAFMHSVQLVNLLNYIFNFKPPNNMCHKELCIRDRWTRELFGKEWRNLCDSVVYLCAYIGMNPAKMTYSVPHSNLMDFGSFVMQTGNIHGLGSHPCRYMATIGKILDTRPEKPDEKNYEEEESWIIVDSAN